MPREFRTSQNWIRGATLTDAAFFERNRIHYYDNLNAARTKNNLVQWLTFFLVGVLETAENSIQTFHKIIKLPYKYS